MLMVIASLAGISLGLIGGPYLVIIPWGIVGLVIGYLSPTKIQTLLTSFLFGFFLILFFMIGGYHGNLPLITRILPFSVLGLVGGVCGLLAGFVGMLIKQHIFTKSMTNKKPWFHSKKYGYGWGLPARWQGWIVLLLYLVFIIYDFIGINRYSHSGFDTLLHFVPHIILATIILIFIVRITSGKPKWRWGT